MQPVSVAADYLAQGPGRCFVAPDFLHFFAHAGLCGTAFWGCPGEAAIRAFTRVVEVELPERSPPHAAFVDVRRLTGADDAAFRALVAYFGPRAEVFGRNVLRQAIVRPDGVLGAVVAGFYEVTPAAHPERTRFFEDPVAALTWLGEPHPAALLAELEQLQALATGTPAAVQALRGYIAAHPRGAALREAARALGVAQRTLQEQLRAAGTSFRREVNLARVRAAQRLLETSDAKLAAIAADVGCASPQHFSALFRKETGEAPSAWRARRRRGGGRPGP